MNHLKFIEWASGSEMLDALRYKHLISLRSGAEGVHKYYELDLPVQYDDLKVVIFSTGHRAPSTLWLESQSKLILACDSSVHKIDLTTERVEYSRQLTGVFYEFLRVDETGTCIVLHQLGILCIAPDGATMWSVDTGIVEDFVCDDADSIRLAILDELSLDVNLNTGVATERQSRALR